MTWYEFVNSAYNKNHQFGIDYTGGVYYTRNGVRYSVTRMEQNNHYILQTKDMKILDGEVYDWYLN